MATQLPELSQPMPDSLKLYPDQPRLETQKKDGGVTGLREEKHAIIASRAGDVELPGVELRWFNTRTGRAETARLPARTLRVAAAAPVPGAAPAAPVEPPRAPADTAAAAAAASDPPRRPDPGPALRQLDQACRARDPAAAEHALLAWALATWPQRPPRSLGALARRLDAGAAAAVRRLESSRYGNAAGDWSGQGLVEALRAWRPGPAGRGHDDALPPLHPNLES